MLKMDQIIDTVENTEGPAVLVTISTGKAFSAGMDLKYWTIN